MSAFKTEAELAAAVVVYLESLLWDVYQEVGCGQSVADLVGVQDDKIMVVETKRSLTFEVIAQALQWKSLAHMVFVAVPYAKLSAGRRLAFKICRERGIGVLEARPAMRDVAETIEAEVRDSVEAGLVVRQEHKTYARAGSANGGHWTPFKSTCEALRREVARGPAGRTLIEVVKGLDHHYSSPSSARTNLGSWIEKGKVPGVSLEKQGSKTIVCWAAPCG